MAPPPRPMGRGDTGETSGLTNRRANTGRILRGLGAAGSAECAVGERGREEGAPLSGRAQPLGAGRRR